jgi:hypothetical protein
MDVRRLGGIADRQCCGVTSDRSAPMSAKPCTSLTLTPSMYSIVSTRLDVSPGNACRAASVHIQAGPGLRDCSFGTICGSLMQQVLQCDWRAPLQTE